MKLKEGTMEGILFRQAGQEGVILGADETEKQFARIGLNLAKYDIEGTNLVLLYHTREVLKIGRQRFLVGSALDFHKNQGTISELNEDEVFEAVMELVEREVKITADGNDFMAYELY